MILCFRTVVFFICACSFFCASNPAQAQSNKNDRLNYDAFCFYYSWYGNPQHDGKYIHWAHAIMKQHPTDTISGSLPGGDNIGANFFPQLGTYSNSDTVVTRQHMQMLEKAGIGNLVLTWWGKESFMAKSVNLIMNEAAKKGITVSFHIEPFGGRNAQTTRDAIVYLIDTYGKHPAFYRSEKHGKPFFFIYDSYLTPETEWATLLQPEGKITIRQTSYDAIMIGLWLSESAKPFITNGGFDGFYTYFASTGFTPGSTPSNWNIMSEWAVQQKKIFIPCVGPGYIDTRVRPWNNKNTKDRENGKYYDRMFKSAIASSAPYIGITSFNEWHEGTQIEPAIPFKSESFNYLDYRPRKPDYYLKRTKYWLKKYQKALRKTAGRKLPDSRTERVSRRNY